MEKEFVTYEQALALKELGFDETCFATYKKDACNSTKPFEYDIDYPTKVELDHNLCPKNSDYINDWVSALLKQQAFRWFREEYGFFYDNLCYVGNIWKFTIYSNDIKDYFQSGNYITYEEAESACLDKLIEIVKNGK